MSLIQEALRRQSQETGVPLTLVPRTGVIPPPLPPPSEAPPPRRWPWLLLILLLALVGASAYGWKLLHTTGTSAIKPSPIKITAPPPPARPPMQPAAIAQTVTNTPATNNIIAKARAILETTRTPERHELVMSPPHQPPATAPQPPVVTQPAPTTPSAPPPQPMKVAVQWPKLAVTGVMAQNGGNGMVFINGQMLKTGDSLEGVHIAEVREDGARLVFQGETNFIRVGRSNE